MTIIFKFRDTDKTRTFDSEMSTKVEKKQPNTPCTQALKQAKSFFNVSVSLSKFWFIKIIWFEDVDKFLEKELFPGFCLLGRLWKRNLWLSLLKICHHLWIKSFHYIKVSKSENAHRYLEKNFFQRLLTWAPVNKDPLAVFSQLLLISLNQIFLIYQYLGNQRLSQIFWKKFSSFFLAWVVVNKASLAVFAQLFSLCLNQMFSTYRCLEIRRCSQICWNLAKATLQKISKRDIWWYIQRHVWVHAWVACGYGMRSTTLRTASLKLSANFHTHLNVKKSKKGSFISIHLKQNEGVSENTQLTPFTFFWQRK